MLNQALRFLLDTAFSLITYALLLRFMMQWLRAPFRNPLGQAVMALTDWAVKPVRRVLMSAPRAAEVRRPTPRGGQGNLGAALRFLESSKGLDAPTLVLVWVAEFLWLVALELLNGLSTLGGAMVATLAVLACVEIVKAALWLLIIVIFAQAILSWVAPDGPFSGVLNALTFRFLAPIRRRIPPVGGVLDLSPLIVIVLAQLALMLPVRWLEGIALTLFR